MRTPDPRRGRIRKFNPGTLQSDRDLIEQFVVRLAELDSVLEVLKGNIDTPSCQHLIVVAPRGRGKTMLVARAAAELRTNDDFSQSLLPVRFMEESHEIFDVADFWLETLFYLAQESGTTHPEMARELQNTYTDLSRCWGERSTGDRARAAVLGAADRIDKKLVLIIENLQALSGSVDDDFGWQLREILQSEPRIVLLASATSRFESLDDPQEAFFELFRTVELGPLATAECRRLWQTITGNTIDTRDIRPLEILTGGNCRLLTIVASFSEHRSLRRLMEELVRLVDEHTEYFRGHLEVLPRSERRVYVAILDLWHPSRAGEVADRARMDIRAVSTMLGRLIQRGAIVTQSAAGSRKLYAAAEPLYSIYYKLRRERDEAAVVEGLIQFMMAFYDRFALYGIFDRLSSEVREVPSLHSGIDRVLARKPLDQNLHSEMVWRKLEDVSRKAWNHRIADVQLRLDRAIEAAFEEEAYGRVIELVDTYVAEGWDVHPGVSQEHQAAFLAHLRSEAYFGMGEFARVIPIGTEVTERFRDSRDTFILYRSSLVLHKKVLAQFELGDYRGTISSAQEVINWFGNRKDSISQQVVAWTMYFAAQSEDFLGNVEAEILVLNELLDRFWDSELAEIQEPVLKSLTRKGDIIRVHNEDEESSLSIYNKAIHRYGESKNPEIVPGVIVAFMNRAFAQGGMGDFEGEISSYDAVIERTSEDETVEHKWGIAVACKAMRLAEIGRTDDALKMSAALEQTFGASQKEWRAVLAWMGMSARAIALTVRRDSAWMEAFQDAYERFPAGNEFTTRVMIRIVLNLVALGAQERDLVELLANDKAKCRTIAPLVVALRERTGQAVRVPAEVRAVASDIRNTLEEKSEKGILTAY